MNQSAHCGRRCPNQSVLMASARVVNRVVNTKILLPLEFITETGHLLRRKKSKNEKLISFFFALAQMTFLSRHRQFFYSLASHHARRSFFHRRLIEIFICKDFLLLPSDKSSIFCLHYKCLTAEGGQGIIHGCGNARGMQILPRNF